jgi:hypothetical protein
MKLRLPLVVSSVLLAGCANYDFSKARRADGSFDTAKLIADLAASGEPELSDGVWIPLIHMDITSFKASRGSQSAPYFHGGFELSHIDAWGPLFLGGSTDLLLVDEKGETIETSERSWVLWSVAYAHRELEIETTRGVRFDGSDRVLLVFGGETSAYRQTQAKAP